MKWSKLDTGKEHGDVPFDVTLRELDRLDERVGSYSLWNNNPTSRFL
jgi:hypothetical protein